MEYILLIIACIFINNVVLAQFLGICPFIGVSRKVETSLGMGMAVTFVMALATMLTWIIDIYILRPLGLESFLQTLTFILVIAALVQFIEVILKKMTPALYQALGIFLPLITTNCAVLGIALLTIQNEYSLLKGVVYATSTAIGFAVALVIFAGIREQMDASSDIPEGMKGTPIALVTTGLLAMAFMGFAGLV